MLISLSNVPNLLQNDNLLFSAYFGGHFCYHSNGKVELIPDFYTLAMNMQKLVEKDFYV